MQPNVLALSVSLTDDTKVISEKFSAANCLLCSTDQATGRTTKAYLDVVEFGGSQLAPLKKGACVELTGRFESHKREGQPWRLRFIVATVKQNGAPAQTEIPA